METQNTENGQIEVWTPEEVAKALDAGEIALIDVRTPQEYMFEHVAGAMLLPMAFFCTDRLPSQEGKRVVFYCGSSMRSGKMAEKALAEGFGPVAHMKDGFAGWKAAKLPYTGTDMATGAPKEVTP